MFKKNEIPPVDIIYPTKDTVEFSKLGPPVSNKSHQVMLHRRLIVL